MTNASLINYFKVGKVFRFQNMISAQIDGDNFFVKSPNVVYHIHSVNGIKAVDFIGAKSILAYEKGKIVLFPAGSEFLVCKVEQIGDQKHIYLRNVQLGLSEQTTVMWTDDKLFGHLFYKYERTLGLRMQSSK